jgi:hypothetical protein
MFKLNRLTQAVMIASVATAPLSAYAATITGTAKATSVEAITGIDYVSNAAMNFTTQATTSVGNFINLNFTGTFDDKQAFVATAIACTDSAGNDMTAQYYSSTTTTATYEVKTLTAGDDGNAQVCAFPADTFRFDATEAVADAAATTTNTGLSVHATTTTAGGGTLETILASNAVELIDVIASEYTVTTPLDADGIVDVGANRYKFTGGGLTDVIKAKITETSLADGATIGSTSTMTLKGDFSWMQDTASTNTSFTFLTGYSVGTTELSGSAAITTTCTATQCQYIAADTDTFTTTITVPSTNAVVIPSQSFSVDAVVAYTNVEPAAGVAKTEASTVTAGSWTMNGTATTVYSVPFGGTVSRFLWVSNSGATDGVVTATVTYDGTTYPATGEFALGNAGKRSNTKLDAVLDEQMLAVSALAPTSGRADVNITVTLPQTSTQVYGAYKIDADRLALETSDTLNANEGLCADLKLINSALDAQSNTKADYAAVTMACRD